MTPRVLVVGDIMTDVIVRPEGPLVRGADRWATIRTLPGGSGANQAAWMSHLGLAVGLVAKVGRADLDDCRAMMRRCGVTPRLAADDDEATGTLVTLLDPDGQRSFLTDRGANDTLDIADLPDALLDGLRLLHISGYALFARRSRLAVLDLLHRASRRGLTFTVDPASVSVLASVGPSQFLQWTKGAALCCPNADEAAVLAGTQDEALQRRVLSAHYASVIIKRGPDGADLVGPDGALILRLPAPPVEAVDTTGAGDAFFAAYLAARLTDAPPEVCLGQAITAGSSATTTFGGRPPHGSM